LRWRKAEVILANARTRLVAVKLRETFRRQFFIDNRAGADQSAQNRWPEHRSSSVRSRSEVARWATVVKAARIQLD